MRIPRWFVSIATLGGLLAPLAATAVTIDATALSSPTFRLFDPSVLGPYPTTVVQNLALGAGTYAFTDEANGAFAFDVDAGGLVTYNPAFENFLDGAGTANLTVRGFDITVDARTLTSPQFSLPHITGSTTVTSYRPSDVVLPVTVLPLDYYPFGDNGGNFISFHVDYSGNVQYPPGSEDYLQGAGTPNLVVRGFDITIDARALTSPTFSLGGITGLTTVSSYRPTSAVLSITGIPGVYDFRDAISNDFVFDIDADGFVRYTPAYEGFLDGAGTTALAVPGFPLAIDVRGIAAVAPTFNFVGLINPGNSSVIHNWVGIPGSAYFFATGIDPLFFTVDLAGHYQGLPALYGAFPVTGNGTTLLRIGGNDPPVVSITGPASGTVVAVGTPVAFTGSFTDEAGDTHTAEWSFDGVSASGSVDETSGTVTASHTFTAAGVYFVTLTVTDDQGESGTATTVDGLDAIVVVYDPDGGFVTGGGWIQSPAGAYVPDPSLVGKANFGFVSRYQNGASTPSGQTEFQFKAAGLNFRSTSYDWLVVADARAQYKGSGTINGAGDYRFMLTAIDGDLLGGDPADKFRIRVWDSGSGAPVYDNQIGAPDSAGPTTALGGGSIVIHKANGGGSSAARPSPGENAVAPLGFALHPSAPNPTRSRSVISFDLPSAARVKLAIYDAAGREIATLADGPARAGRHANVWDGRDRSGAAAVPGLYFVRVEARPTAGDVRWVATRRLALVK
jgi:PKD repeat protein